MSVSLGKLNKAGLGNGSFGVNKKTTGVSTQAAKNLASSSAATKSSVFSFGQSRGTNWVGGQHINRDTSKYNYQGIRNQANARGVYTPQRGNNISHAQTTVKYTGDDGTNFMKGQLIGQTIMGGINLLNQLGAFDKLKGGNVSQTNSRTLDSTFTENTAKTLNSSAATSAMSGMSGASDSISLRGAIAEANGTLSNMNLEAQKGDYQKNYDTANSNMSTYQADVSKTEKGVSSAKQDVSAANNSVETTTTVRDTKLIALKNADAVYGKAVEAHAQAQDATKVAEQGLSNAQATLSNTPPEIPDGNGGMKPNPAYQQAKEAVAQAETKLNEAKAAEEKAKAERDTAKENVDSSNQAVKDAEAQLDKAQDQLGKAKDAQTKAQVALKTAENACDKAKITLEKAEADIDKFKAYQQDTKELQSAIDKQMKRLEKMEKEEQEDYSKLTNNINKGVAKNDKRAAQINPNDGMNLKEKWLEYKSNRTNNKMAGQLDKKDGLAPMNADTNYIAELKKQTPDFTVGGQNYYQGTSPSGEKVFLRDNMPITEEMFKMAQAGL